MIKLAIVGAGDLGLQLAHHARQTGLFSVAGFFDDFATPGATRGGDPVIGRLADIEDFFRAGAYDQLLIGIGYKHLVFRQALFERLRNIIPFATLLHPQATIDPTCSIGAGAVVYPGCVLDMHTTIGENTILNIDCAIAHHSRIGASCFLSPSVKIAGFVSVAPVTMLGIGTIVIDNLNIASHTRTGAGAVVVNDICEAGLYVGVPARLQTEGASA